MTEKQKNDMLEEMRQFVENGIPKEAIEKEYNWEKENPIVVCTEETKQRDNEKDGKKLDIGNNKKAKPIRSEDAVIRVDKTKEEKDMPKKGDNR